MQNNIYKGAMYLLAAELVLAGMAALIKYLSTEVEHEILVFARNLFGLLTLAPIVVHYGINKLKTNKLPIHLLRSISGLGGMYGFFYMIGHLPLAEAILVKLSAPIFIPLIALIWLGEKINWRTRWCIVIGFIGVVLVLRPGGDNFQAVALIGIGAAISASVAKVCIRRMANTEPGYRIVFYFALFSLLFSTPLAWLNGELPRLEVWPYLVGIGMGGTLGQLLMTRAFQVANPGQVGPFTYVSVIYAAIIGWLFWGEILLLTTIIGSVLIVLAGVWNLSGGSSKQVGTNQKQVGTLR